MSCYDEEKIDSKLCIYVEFSEVIDNGYYACDYVT